MANEAQAQESASAVPDSGTESPNIDIGEVTLEQLDKLMTTGTAELPVVGSGDGKPAAAAPAVVEPPAKVEPPVVEEPKAKVEPEPPVVVEEVIEETRTPEEIAEAQTAARERVKTEGGDEAAQDAAAEEAGKPQAAAPAAPVVEPEPKVEPDDEKDETRFRHRGSNRAINALFKAREAAGKPITWAEAERIVLGSDVSGPAAETTPTAASTQLETTVSTLRTEVEGLRAKLDEAGENEGVVDKAFSKLVQELASKEADLKLAERDLRDAKEDEAAAIEDNNAQWTANSQKSKQRALEMYGAAGLGNEKTEFGKAVADRVIAMRDPKHPDHQILFAATAPETIAMKVATEMGIVPAKKKAAAATPPTPPPVIPPKSKVAPVPGAKSSAAAQPTKEDAQKQLEHLQSDDVTLQELDELFEGGPGGLRKSLHAAAR